MRKAFPPILILVLCVATLAAGAWARGDRDEEKARKKAWEDARKNFLRVMKIDDPKARADGIRKIAEFADLGAARLMVEKVLPGEDSPGVRDAAVRLIAGTTEPGEVAWLVKKATARGGWRARAPLVEALGGIRDPASEAALRKILEKEKDPRVLSMALFSAAELRMKDAVKPALKQLEHEDWQVRVAAIEALAVFKDEQAVMPLIDLLMNERGRLRHDIAEALKAITGKDFGRDENKWRKWFIERDDVPEEAAAPKPTAGELAGPPKSTIDGPTYFGIKVLSERVLFVFDVSLSMKTPIDVDKMKLAREAAVTGAGASENKDDVKFEETIKWWKIKDRLDLAKAQLKFCIKNLKKTQKFEIVTFSDTVKPWNGGRLLKASTKAKLKAIQYIDTLEVEGATAAGAALDFSFEMAGPGASDKNYKTSVDTVFFMSDGAPSDRSEDEILEQVRSRNRLRKIRIHVVAIVNQSVRFLRLLAKENKGVYKFFQVENK